MSIIISCYCNSFFSPLTASSASTMYNPNYFCFVFFIWEIPNGNTSFFHNISIAVIPSEFSQKEALSSPAEVSDVQPGHGLGLDWSMLLCCGEQVNINTSQRQSDWQEILVRMSKPNIPSLDVWVCSGGYFSPYKSLCAVKVWGVLWLPLGNLCWDFNKYKPSRCYRGFESWLVGLFILIDESFHTREFRGRSWPWPSFSSSIGCV